MREPAGRKNFIAVDYGSQLWASDNGIADDSFRPREAGKRPGKERYITDFVVLLRHFLQIGDVVTEAPTTGSYNVRQHEDAIVEMRELFDHKLYVVGSHSARNECRRNGWVAGESKKLPNNMAAAAIWNVAFRDGARLWTPPSRDQDVIKNFDPLRPNKGEVIALRRSNYDHELMNELVWSFLPRFEDLTEDQKQLLGENGTYNPDLAAAFVVSLKEPLSNTRDGWEKVLGASRDGRPSIYRQVLVVGKPRADYQHKIHVSGLTMSAATNARRSLRSRVLREFPKIRG